MSEPSSWPLSREALRVRVPKHIELSLSKHALTSSLYVTAVGYYPSAELHNMGRNSHDDFILIYCADGQGYLNTDLYDGPIHQGDLFVLPPETPHQYRSSAHLPWTVFWCHFKGESAQHYFDYLYDNSKKPVVTSLEVQIMAAFRELVGAAKVSFTLDSFINVSSVLNRLLVATAQSVKKEANNSNGVNVEAAQEFMRQNLDKNLYLDDLAKLSHVSKYHFSRRYLALTGMTPLQHFTHIKIEHAAVLLEQTSLSISDIAYQLGYDDALYFSRVFKKLMKLSPRAYRKQLIIQR